MQRPEKKFCTVSFSRSTKALFHHRFVSNGKPPAPCDSQEQALRARTGPSLGDDSRDTLFDLVAMPSPLSIHDVLHLTNRFKDEANALVLYAGGDEAVVNGSFDWPTKILSMRSVECQRRLLMPLTDD